MILNGKVPLAVFATMLALQPAAAQETGNGATSDEKPASSGTLSSPAPTPIVAPPDQPSPPAPKPEEAQQEPSAAEPAARVATFVQGQVAPVLGKKVVGPDEKQVVGSIIDLLVDEEGKPRAAVLDLGGFLGVGSRHVAIDWQLLKFRASKPDAPAVLNLDPADLKAAPEYKDVDAAAQVVEPPHAPPAEAPIESTPTTGTPPEAPADQAAPLPSLASPPPQPAPAQQAPPSPPPGNAGQ